MDGLVAFIRRGATEPAIIIDIREGGGGGLYHFSQEMC